MSEPALPSGPPWPGMQLEEVLAVLDALRSAGCRTWVGGGWGVDALVGHQTRAHRDLDLAVHADDARCALEVMTRRGYRVETDWRPVRVELVAPAGWVDLHPVVLDAAGAGVQAGLDGEVFTYPAEAFTTGRLQDVAVPCLSRQQQLRFHEGYAPRDVDRHDLRLLTRSDADG